MSKRYLLPCTCGKTVPVEITQAGQKVRCSCGLELDVPRMMELKRFPEAEGNKDSATPAALSQHDINAIYKAVLFCFGGILILAGIVLALYTYQNYPSITDPVTKRKQLVTPEGKMANKMDIGANAPDDEYFLAIMAETEKNPDYIDLFSPYQTVFIWENLRKGPALGPQFQENFQAFQHAHQIRCVALAVIFTAALIMFIIGSLLKTKTAIVAPRPGSDWKGG